MRNAWFSSNALEAMAKLMVHTYIEYVIQTFRDNAREDSRYEKYGNLARILQLQHKVYKIWTHQKNIVQSSYAVSWEI